MRTGHVDDGTPTCLVTADSARSLPKRSPGKTVAVVGDGAVGLLGVLAAKQLGPYS